MFVAAGSIKILLLLSLHWQLASSFSYFCCTLHCTLQHSSSHPHKLRMHHTISSPISITPPELPPLIPLSTQQSAVRDSSSHSFFTWLFLLDSGRCCSLFLSANRCHSHPSVLVGALLKPPPPHRHHDHQLNLILHTLLLSLPHPSSSSSLSSPTLIITITHHAHSNHPSWSLMFSWVVSVQHPLSILRRCWMVSTHSQLFNWVVTTYSQCNTGSNQHHILSLIGGRSHPLSMIVSVVIGWSAPTCI